MPKFMKLIDLRDCVSSGEQSLSSLNVWKGRKGDKHILYGIKKHRRPRGVEPRAPGRRESSPPARLRSRLFGFRPWCFCPCHGGGRFGVLSTMITPPDVWC